MNAKKKSKKKSRKKRGKSAEYTIFTAFFFFGIIITLLLTVIPGCLYLQAKGWDEIRCKIISSKVERVNTSSKGSVAYVPKIEYSYSIKGKEYKSDKYSFFDTKTNEGTANDIIKDYPVDRQVTCYVDPGNPEKAILNREFSWAILYGLAGICICLIGAVGLYNTYKGNWGNPKRKNSTSNV